MYCNYPKIVFCNYPKIENLKHNKSYNVLRRKLFGQYYHKVLPTENINMAT